MKKGHNTINIYPFFYQVVVLFYTGKEVESGMNQLNGMASVGNLGSDRVDENLKMIR